MITDCGACVDAARALYPPRRHPLERTRHLSYIAITNNGGTLSGRHLSLLSLIVVCAHIACGGADTGVSPLPPGYAGEWMGTTPTGTSIRFSVSEADTVSSITLTYNFSAGCAGTLVYTNLALSIHRLDPPAPPPFDQPGFGHSSTTDGGATGTLIGGYFSPDRRSASGQFTLVNYTGCDKVVLDQWSATRR